MVAQQASEVADVLSQVHCATEAGQWAFGYLAYEAASGLDPHLVTYQEAPLEMPLAWFGIGGPPVQVPIIAANEPGAAERQRQWTPTWTPAGHGERVASIKSRIAAGDTYQCNLTERMAGQVSGDPFTFYRDLALGQGGAYNAYLDLGRWVIASASPELFFERRGPEVELRPMKGTARRGRFLVEDRLLTEQLQTSEKERAENLMIVDLLRNDLSRIAETGTVSVPALFTVERYRTVLQMTSTIVGRLRPGADLVNLFTALFPSGSITGAPKVSSMKIIHSLEKEPRGVYCGAVGFVAPPTAPINSRFSVAIRTAAIDKTSGTAVYGTGGGITWGSDPAEEQSEIVAKTLVLTTRPVSFDLVETMRHTPALGLLNRRRHLQRLADSAEYLGFPCDQAAIEQALDDRLSAGDEAVLDLRLAPDGSLTITLNHQPWTSQPLRLELDHDPVNPLDWRLYHRTTLRYERAARRTRRPGVDDLILLNASGECTETTHGTITVKLDGRWWTPPLSSGCLPGVARAALLAEGKLVERVLRPADLDIAKAIAVVSSAHGWRTAQFRTAIPAHAG